MTKMKTKKQCRAIMRRYSMQWRNEESGMPRRMACLNMAIFYRAASR